ncbi:MAG: DnaJ C-terminal domain-containing protein [Waterburya sp.]
MSSTEFKDYYAILGVKKTAQTDEIKKKFRKLALKYHPDRNQGNKAAEAKFKEISEAYDVLSDEDKRSKYDRFGQYWQQSATTGYPGYKRNSTSSSNTNTNVDFNSTDFSQYGNFEEFINELLGRFSSSGNSSTSTQNYSQTSSRNSNFQDFAGVGQQSTSTNSEANINLTFAEAFRGTIKRLGIGGETLEVRIPAGAKPGSRIRLAGKSPRSPYSQQRGDLYLNVELNPHPFFSFEGDNLVCEVPVTPDEAVLGSSISIPTPDGNVSMKVPAGISTGQVLRLRGKGWSSPKGNRTDQLVRIIITIPQQVSPQEKEYYEKIRDLRTKNPRDGLQGISF